MEDIRSIKVGCSQMDIEWMIRYLGAIEKDYKDTVTSTGKINISYMAHDCKSMLEEVLKNYDELHSEYEKLLLESTCMQEVNKIATTPIPYITKTTLLDANAATINIAGTGKLLT